MNFSEDISTLRNSFIAIIVVAQIELLLAILYFP